MALLLLPLLALMLLGCESISPTTTDFSFTPVPGILEFHDPAYASAQATIDAGQRMLLDLSIKETEVSINMSQAADAAALATWNIVNAVRETWITRRL